LLVDTNILIYATLAADPRHQRAQELLALRHRAGVELFVSVQNLAEMYPNLTGSKTNRQTAPPWRGKKSKPSPVCAFSPSSRSPSKAFTEPSNSAWKVGSPGKNISIGSRRSDASRRNPRHYH
jgi:predicted nucleic acid-binding protein